MSIAELAADLENQKIAASQATEKLTAATEQLTKLQAQADEANAALTAEQAKTAQLTADLEAAKENLATAESAKLAAEKDRDEAKIETAKAREISARFGAAAPAKQNTAGNAELTTPAQIKAHYATLEGEDRFAFFQKHKNALLS